MMVFMPRPIWNDQGKEEEKYRVSKKPLICHRNTLLIDCTMAGNVDNIRLFAKVDVFVRLPPCRAWWRSQSGGHSLPFTVLYVWTFVVAAKAFGC